MSELKSVGLLIILMVVMMLLSIYFLIIEATGLEWVLGVVIVGLCVYAIDRLRRIYMEATRQPQDIT